MAKNELFKTEFDYMRLVPVSQLERMFGDASDIQRLVDTAHVESIYNGYKEELKTRAPHISPLFIGKCGSEHYILDGQHRFQALLRLLKNDNIDEHVYIHVCTYQTREDMEKAFRSINKIVPVSRIPDTVNRSSVNKVAKHFYDKTTEKKSIFSTSSRPQRPNISRTLFEEIIGKFCEIYTKPEDIIAMFERENKRLIDAPTHEFKTAKETDFQIIKWRSDARTKGGIYFGMHADLSSLRALLPSKVVPGNRSKVPVMLRGQLWKMYYGDKKEGPCVFCDYPITRDNCHIAHNIAHNKGGDMSINNLYPCCDKCNLGMGTRTYEEVVELVDTFLASKNC